MCHWRASNWHNKSRLHFNGVLKQPISDDLFNFNREDVVGTINVSHSDIQHNMAYRRWRQGGTMWYFLLYPESHKSVMFSITDERMPQWLQQLERDTLLSVPGKVFCSVLVNRLQNEVDALLREEQAGFGAGRSCSRGADRGPRAPPLRLNPMQLVWLYWPRPLVRFLSQTGMDRTLAYSEFTFTVHPVQAWDTPPCPVSVIGRYPLTPVWFL